MSIFKKLNIILVAAVTILVVFGSGCRPSVREVVGVVSTIPLGTSRDGVKETMLKAYSKKYSDKASRQGYMLAEPPRPVTNDIINAEKTLIAVLKKQGHYVYIYPSNLYDSLSEKCFSDGIGLVAEAPEGNGSLTIYYDNHTNYIGFIAESEYNK
jgi:hypothetical protein